MDIITKINATRRNITHSVLAETREDGTEVYLAQSITHRDKGRYLVSIWRELHKNGFVTVSIRDDRYSGEYADKGARYSAKALESIAAEHKAGFVEAASSLVDWAREATKK